MHPAFLETGHRPWPLPGRAWRWGQAWLDLAFIHYRIDAEALRRSLPVGLEVQEYDGSAWLGLVPFRMARMMRRPLPWLPGISTFPELNLRTYVEAEGKPGVWFFSLDADSWPVVFGGRNVYGLPYHRADMEQVEHGGWVEFQSLRREGGVSCRLRYRGVGEVFEAKRGSFEYWVAERYCLYSASRKGRLMRVEVQHGPWPLQWGEVVLEENGILSAAGLVPESGAPVCHFSKGVDVVSYGGEPVG